MVYLHPPDAVVAPATLAPPYDSEQEAPREASDWTWGRKERSAVVTSSAKCMAANAEMASGGDGYGM